MTGWDRRLLFGWPVGRDVALEGSLWPEAGLEATTVSQVSGHGGLSQVGW